MQENVLVLRRYVLKCLGMTCLQLSTGSGKKKKNIQIEMIQIWEGFNKLETLSEKYMGIHCITVVNFL